MLKRCLIYITLLLLVVSCMEQEPYPGYSPFEEFFFKRLTFGDDDNPAFTEAHVTDFLLEYCSYYNPEARCNTDTVFQFHSQQTEDHLVTRFLHDKIEKDSVHLLLPWKSVKASFLPVTHCDFEDTTLVEVRIKLEKMYSEKEFFAYQRAIAEDLEMEEMERLAKYLKSNNINKSRYKEGIYYIPLKDGRGQYATDGSELTIHYKGFFLDSTLFDSTYEDDSPLIFNFGDPDQVIRGFEIALAGMRRGDKARVIIPSHLAFGEKGSSTGLVPPFTTVMYELELARVIGGIENGELRVEN